MFKIFNLAFMQKVKYKISNFFGINPFITSNKIKPTLYTNNHIQTSIYAYKEYLMPSGKILKYQGYENFALDLLIKNGITESDIINDPNLVPNLTYVDELGKTCKHIVDMYIPSKNLCIEVKSDYTLQKDYYNVLAKQKYAIAQGYNYEIIVFDRLGNIITKY
jgi:hypothetical protein